MRKNQNVVMQMWEAPEVSHQVNLKGLAKAAGSSALIGAVLVSLATLLQSNASAFGTWGPIVGAAATLVIQIIRQLTQEKPNEPLDKKESKP